MFEYTLSERLKHLMGALGKGSNAFTIESLRGVAFYQLHHHIMLYVPWIFILFLVYKSFGKIIKKLIK